MNKTILVPLLCASLVFAVTGCYTLSKVNFGNGTATAVKVKSSQTGQEINVPPGKFKELPHATGDLIVTTQTNGQFKFSGVEPPVLDDYLVKRKSFFGPGHITLNLRIETNMQLYVVMPGEKTVDEKAQQPAGYPKIAEKVSN
jgi:hypothetical protein